MPSKKVEESQLAHIVALVTQVTHGTVQGWQVLSEVWPNLPAGQVPKQVVSSKKVTPLHVTHVVPLVEHVAQGAVQG